MKRLFLLLLILLQATAGAGQTFDEVWPYLTPQGRAQWARDTVAKMPAEQMEWFVPSGEYDFGDKEFAVLKTGLKITAKEAGKAIWLDASVWRAPNPATGDRGASTAFIHGDAQTWNGVVMRSTCPPNRQSAVFGPGFDSTTPRKVRLIDTALEGRAWGYYMWHCDRDEVEFLPGKIGNTIVAANVGLNGGRSSGVNAQIVRIGDGNALTINIDPTRSTQGGSVTNPTDGGSMGIVMRGGQLILGTCTINGVGQGPGRGPRMVAVTDHLEGGSSKTVAQIGRLITNLKPGSATELFDIDFTLGKVQVGGSGSGPDGSLLIRKSEPVK